MDWEAARKKAQEILRPESRHQTFAIRETAVTDPTRVCAICKSPSTRHVRLFQVECCGRIYCHACYFQRFYTPGEFNKLSPVGNQLTRWLREATIIPGILDRYEHLEGVCRFECPFCKTETVYNYEKREKTLRRKPKGGWLRHSEPGTF